MPGPHYPGMFESQYQRRIQALKRQLTSAISSGAYVNQDRVAASVPDSQPVFQTSGAGPAPESEESSLRISAPA